MDIRKFFVNLKRKKDREQSSDSDDQQDEKMLKETQIQSAMSHEPGFITTTEDAHSQKVFHDPDAVASSHDDCTGVLSRPTSSNDLDQNPCSKVDDCNENDIGRFIGQASILSTEKKKDLLKNCWMPPKMYNFSEDAKHLKRKFNHSWLETYSPWLVYSRRQKGAFCKYCTLFPPNQSSFKGVLGSFIIRPFCKFKDIHEQCKKHIETHFHKAALVDARSFLESLPVDVQVNKYSQRVIEENRKVISSIISCIIFCGSHDLALRGKHYGEGILEDLYKLRIDAGDVVLRKHFEQGKRNASYRSVDTQNEIISICGDVLKADIIKKVKDAEAYSVLADETADISGKEQLSIGLRYFDEEKNEVQEVFVGFTELKGLDGKSIAQTIDEFLTREELNPSKCVGLGFDGCSTMSGIDGGVQAILRKKYTKALFFHCSSHKLNLVINDLNALPEVRNSTGTIKSIITFFRESVLRRKLIPNIPKLCETRWSEKHKSIRIFVENFPTIMEALETLSREGNSATRKNAYQLHATASKSSFILCILLIAKYSALLEPVVNVFQSIALDAVKASQHIKRILQLLKSHRDDPDKITNEILRDATIVSERIGLEEDTAIAVPRIVGRQCYRNNHPAENPSEFWKRSLIIPYLDSIITSLEVRFAEENTPSFALSQLHPAHMQNMPVESLKEACETFAQFYDIPNIKNEIELWQQLWQNKSNVAELSVVDVLKDAKVFFPGTFRALKILITLPFTTCTIERSFSSLRRMKTWLRSTMVESRLNGLAMMSVHRKYVTDNLADFNNKVVEHFARNPRRLCFN
ncbi:unnamed protein product [Callosobruchus maculatus]|uniref:TTF-type domain-containing protein n=1 Tax=Callosobruchus maculatus TaxID=64391 RepID=A0A653BRN0_CALMS|nr:unnamed protein product [Callosobruchus maculatus]